MSKLVSVLASDISTKLFRRAPVIKSSSILHRCCSNHANVFNQKQFSHSDNLLRRKCFPISLYTFNTQPLRGVKSGAASKSVTISQTTKMMTKRPARKKITGLAEGEGTQKVRAYAVGEEIDLEELKKALDKQGLYSVVELPRDASDALYVKAKYDVNGGSREIFFFKQGSVVFWNIPNIERSEVVRFLQKHCDQPYDISLSVHESEQMEFKLTDSVTNLVGDKINFCTTEKTENEQHLEKYACSNALTQSVKLAMWESSLENFISSIEQVTEDLRDGKKIKMSRREVLRKTGELFALRHEINLSSDLLDTPDFYWERDALESLYQRVCNHLVIAKRTKVLNERIHFCCELTDLLSSHLNDTHHVRLEWMIIVLIMVEVVFETLHYTERYLSAIEDRNNDVAVNTETVNSSS